MAAMAASEQLSEDDDQFDGFIDRFRFGGYRPLTWPWLLAALIALAAGIAGFVLDLKAATDLLAPGMKAIDLPFIAGSLLALAVSALLAVAIVLFTHFHPGPIATLVIAVPTFVIGIVAAVEVWFFSQTAICGIELCRPGHTWAMLPFLVTAGLHAALGAGVVALVSHRIGWWIATGVIFGLAFLAGLFGWVEISLFGSAI